MYHVCTVYVRYRVNVSCGSVLLVATCGTPVAPLWHPCGTPGDDKISEEEFALYFSKVMKVETAHAKALFRVADATRDGFLEYREFLGLMAILYRHLLTIRGTNGRGGQTSGALD